MYSNRSLQNMKKKKRKTCRLNVGIGDIIFLLSRLYLPLRLKYTYKN